MYRGTQDAFADGAMAVSTSPRWRPETTTENVGENSHFPVCWTLRSGHLLPPLGGGPVQSITQGETTAFGDLPETDLTGPFRCLQTRLTPTGKESRLSHTASKTLVPREVTLSGKRFV